MILQVHLVSMQLDYKVSARKVRDIFKMAGTVVDVELKEDQDGKSRGMAVVKFEHPIEAVQVCCCCWPSVKWPP